MGAGDKKPHHTLPETTLEPEKDGSDTNHVRLFEKKKESLKINFSLDVEFEQRHNFLCTSALRSLYSMLHVAKRKMGAKAGMELRRLRKVARKAGLTVSHHCPMEGM